MDAKAQIPPKEFHQNSTMGKMADERNGRNNELWKARGTLKTGIRIVQIRI